MKVNEIIYSRNGLIVEEIQRVDSPQARDLG